MKVLITTPPIDEELYAAINNAIVEERTVYRYVITTDEEGHKIEVHYHKF